MMRVMLDDVEGKTPGEIARKARIMAASYFECPANKEYLHVVIGPARPAEMMVVVGEPAAVTVWKADVEVVRKK